MSPKLFFVRDKETSKFNHGMTERIECMSILLPKIKFKVYMYETKYY
jgi:hypothetical protein